MSAKTNIENINESSEVSFKLDALKEASTNITKINELGPRLEKENQIAFNNFFLDALKGKNILPGEEEKAKILLKQLETV